MPGDLSDAGCPKWYCPPRYGADERFSPPGHRWYGHWQAPPQAWPATPEGVASAIPAGVGRALWIYFAAPLAGMLLAAEVHVRLARSKRAGCAKVVHSLPCIFCGGA